MKNLQTYISETLISESSKTKWFYVPEIELSTSLSKSQLKDWMDHGVYPDVQGRMNMDYFTVYFTGKKAVKYFMPWLKDYLGSDSILQAANQFDGLYDAYTGKITELYAVIDDIDMTEQLKAVEEKKMKDAGVKILYYEGEQADYTAVLLCTTKEAFNTVAMPWLEEYCQGNEEDVIATFPEVEKYL